VFVCLFVCLSVSFSFFSFFYLRVAFFASHRLDDDNRDAVEKSGVAEHMRINMDKEATD
jgi:hypothetical protein